MKYTKEILQEAVKNSENMYDVLRYFKLALSGGGHFHLSKRIKYFKIDTSHFKWGNAGSRHTGPKPIPLNEIFKLRKNGFKRSTKTLRCALIKSGRKEICECGQGPMWLGKPLRLQIDHKNGNVLDDRRRNLRFLCPNCHTQTETYGSRNIKSR